MSIKVKKLTSRGPFELKSNAIFNEDVIVNNNVIAKDSIIASGEDYEAKLIDLNIPGYKYGKLTYIATFDTVDPNWTSNPPFAISSKATITFDTDHSYSIGDHVEVTTSYDLNFDSTTIPPPNDVQAIVQDYVPTGLYTHPSGFQPHPMVREVKDSKTIAFNFNGLYLPFGFSNVTDIDVVVKPSDFIFDFGPGTLYYNTAMDATTNQGALTLQMALYPPTTSADTLIYSVSAPFLWEIGDKMNIKYQYQITAERYTEEQHQEVTDFFKYLETNKIDLTVSNLHDNSGYVTFSLPDDSGIPWPVDLMTSEGYIEFIYENVDKLDSLVFTKFRPSEDFTVSM